MKPSYDLLLVIDFQNVYTPEADWACPTMPEAVRNTCQLIDSGTVNEVILTKFIAPDPALGTWEQYNLENEAINTNMWLNELVPELEPYAAKYPVYEKSTYTSMRVPDIMEAAHRADQILLAGVVAECCILATLMEAIDDGHKVVYLTDCISGQSETNETSIRMIAESFSPVHTEVIDSKSWIERKRISQKSE